MGVLLIHFGRNQEALEALETAIQNDAHEPAFHYTKGNILIKLGRITDAQQYYEQGNQLEKR